MAHEKVLIVEDEPDIAEIVAYNLRKEGYTTRTTITGEQALSQIPEFLPDLILLDLMLPGVDGLEVFKRLKQSPLSKDIPVVMLTAKSEDADIITGLEIGADDYITKPFSPKVLIARIRAVIRRSENRDVSDGLEQLKIHDLQINLPKREVRRAGKPIPLSTTEFEILVFLARSPGWVFSRSQIISAIKGDDYPVTERAVDVQILGLRKKLGPSGALIQTVRGIGYRIHEEQ